MTMEYITFNKGGRKLAFENNIYIKQKVLSNGKDWGNMMGGFCPGGFCPGGCCPRGDFVQGDFVRGILSGGFCPGDFVRGFCPGGFCPRTKIIVRVISHKIPHISFLVSLFRFANLLNTLDRAVNKNGANSKKKEKATYYHVLV